MSYVDVGAFPALSTSKTQTTYGPSSGPLSRTSSGRSGGRTPSSGRSGGTRRGRTVAADRHARNDARKASRPSGPARTRSTSGGLLAWLFRPKVKTSTPTVTRSGGIAIPSGMSTSSSGPQISTRSDAPAPSFPSSGGSSGGGAPVVDPGTGSEAYLPEVGPEPTPEVVAAPTSWMKWAVVGACGAAAFWGLKKLRS